MSRGEFRNTVSPMGDPPLRPMTANVLTDLGWLHGTFNLPPYQSLVDFLTPSSQIVKCTRVLLPQGGERLPFVGLRREAIVLVEPTLGDEMVETPGGIGRTTPREVTCLLRSGQVQGTLEVLVNVRVSDFLRQQTQVLVMRRCRYAPYGEPLEGPKARRLDTVIINLSTTIGVAERDG
jgi:hypothetical protein